MIECPTCGDPLDLSTASDDSRVTEQEYYDELRLSVTCASCGSHLTVWATIEPGTVESA